ncbi:dienelactone hydrolase family protein [Chitinophaga sp. Mgbs1]|uniref:Dienelactone hydrolase family protein n=1 Tax=Chitinophaga solisilvae TaxID=1233460 RepID=A0A3S1CU91_9BACT|nr:dienelactone hydrolase family protein [Chitinophaga solisilvae]
MKKLLFLLLLSGITRFGYAQTPSCCHNPDGVTAFAALGSQEEFRMEHKNPLPYVYQGTGGAAVTFNTPDGTPASGFLFKAKKPSQNYLFVYHEWYGLNDYIRKESEKLYNELGGAVNVLAVDCYDGKVATNREDAGKLMQAASRARLGAIMQGALDYAGKSARIATVGWCFGGSLSLYSGLTNGAQNIGTVMYYGMPEKDVSVLKTLHGPVLGLFGNQDKSINPAVVSEFEKNMQAAGKTLTVKRYDAGHGFANPSNPVFNEAATKDAFGLTSAFLKKTYGL